MKNICFLLFLGISISVHSYQIERIVSSGIDSKINQGMSTSNLAVNSDGYTIIYDPYLKTFMILDLGGRRIFDGKLENVNVLEVLKFFPYKNGFFVLIKESIGTSSEQYEQFTLFKIDIHA